MLVKNPLPYAVGDKKIMISDPKAVFNTDYLSKFFTFSLDKRRSTRGNFKHKFHDILLVSLVSALCGIEDYEHMALFAKQELGWFKEHGDFSAGVPCDETIRRLFIALDPVAFEECFSSWISSLYIKRDDGEVIAIDGKTIRGARQKSNPESLSPHILTAWATKQGLALGQLKVAEKSNEITAIPELLNKIYIKGSTITIDAMGCQENIISGIIANKANYIIAVKGNQKTLAWAINDTHKLEKPMQRHSTYQVDHGRAVTRTCWVYDQLAHLENKSKWKDLKRFIVVESETYNKATKKITRETRKYISNLKDSAEEFNHKIRCHWAIENELHWVLDVSFKEDASRKRVSNTAQNINLILKMALSILKRKKSKPRESFKSQKLKALLNRKYREKLLKS